MFWWTEWKINRKIKYAVCYMTASAMDKNETWEGVGSGVDMKVVVFNRMVMGSLTEKATFE